MELARHLFNTAVVTREIRMTTLIGCRAPLVSTVTLAALICVCGQETPVASIPDLEYRSYVQEGDIMLGGLLPLQSSSEGKYCSALTEDTRLFALLPLAEMMNFAVAQVNNKSDLLPNITLGFVIMDTCSTDVTALARSTFFVGHEESAREDDVDQLCTGPSHDEANVTTEWRHHKVVGVIGPGTSRESVMVSSYLGLYQIPTLSLAATSDDLSDKQRYKYFSRLVPSDSHQIEMFMELLLMHNWTYVSLLYSEGSYGENAAKKTERSAKENNICIEYQKRIPVALQQDIYNVIAKNLASGRARVIILFIQYEMADPLFDALTRLNLTGRFFWLCGDFLAYMPQTVTGLSGAIYASGVMQPVPGFREFYGSLSPWNVPTNPWMRQAWAEQFSCEWQPTQGEADCNRFERISDSPTFEDVRLISSKVYEGVQVYALALHALITERCPQNFLNKTQLDDCINGEDFLTYVRRVDLTHDGRPIQFDSNGDLLPVFDIHQVFYQDDGASYTNKIGRWDKEGGLSTESDIQFQWMFGSRNFVDGIPESVCSQPCGPKQYAVQMELPCCWECRTCRDNEKLSQNNTGCELCPEFTWPDEGSQTRCQIIPTVYLTQGDSYGLALLVLSSVGIALTATACILFTAYRQHKLIKASSRELSSVTFLGVTMAFAGVFAFVAEPSTSVCWTRASVFAIAVSTIFSPILVKAVRIYRIFRAGKKSTLPPKCISSAFQVSLAGIMIAVQVILVVVANLQSPPTASHYMPVRTEEYVELVCDQSLTGFILPMAYNILVIVVCAMLGFLTRKLPENFNESWFIFISVATTLFMWLVFVPSYYNAFYVYLQDALLALCLILNAYITITCTFLSKIYAVMFIRQTNLKISVGTTGSLPTTRRSSLPSVQS